MGDYDPCECVCSHQWAMQRLLSILRSSQQYCTENECFGEMPNQDMQRPNEDWGTFMIFMGWMVMALLLFMMRPASLRGQGDAKPRPNGNGGPPPPDVPPVQ